MQREERDPDRQREDQYDREWQEREDERKGASYNITQKHPAQDPNAHAQPTPGRPLKYNNLAAAMDIRKREYQQAEGGQMTAEHMHRVGIDSSKYPQRGGVPAPHDYQSSLSASNAAYGD